MSGRYPLRGTARPDRRDELRAIGLRGAAATRRKAETRCSTLFELVDTGLRPIEAAERVGYTPQHAWRLLRRRKKAQ